MNRSVKVFAPATVANVVCGYDVLGFAVNAPGDEVIMRFKDEPGIMITKISGDDGRLPYDPAKNTVSVSVQHYLNHIGKSDVGVQIELNKKMPIGSGLGSSSASTVAGLFAINTLMDSPFSKGLRARTIGSLAGFKALPQPSHSFAWSAFGAAFINF